MTPASGQRLRRLGLLIELIAVIGLLTTGRGKGDLLASGRLDSHTFLAGCLAIGFVIWLTGTLIYWRRRAD